MSTRSTHLAAALPLLLLPLAPADPVAPAGAPDLAGDWAGWLYMDDGDVPVRVHLERAPDGRGELAARVDLPAAGQLDARFGAVETTGGGLALAYPAEGEARVRLALERRGDDHLAGAVDWLGVAGEGELHRAALALRWEDPEAAAAAVGLYGAPGDVGEPALFVLQQRWGELVLGDAATGAERTLFPRGDGSYVAGPAFYVPAPVERRVRFERDAAGRVAALVQVAGGAETRHPRLPLLREPISVERDGVALHGTLTLPDRPRPACAVVAGGSGWGQRSGVERFALWLAARGVASVIYDKRGHGESGGDAEVPFATTAADLRALAGAARAHPALAGGAVGYLGISRGGWYGALAAAEDGECAFFVDVVGPAVSPIEQETTARLDRLREAGAPAEDLELGERYLRAMWRFAREERGGERYLELRAEVERAGWLAELEGPAELDPAEWRWLRLNGDFDPRPSLRALRCPTLALLGEDDEAVAARVNAPLLRDALWASRAEPCRVLVLPGVDHGLRRARGADGERLARHRAPGWHPDVWEAVGSFLAPLGE